MPILQFLDSTYRHPSLLLSYQQLQDLSLCRLLEIVRPILVTGLLGARCLLYRLSDQGYLAKVFLTFQKSNLSAHSSISHTVSRRWTRRLGGCMTVYYRYLN